MSWSLINWVVWPYCEKISLSLFFATFCNYTKWLLNLHRDKYYKRAKNDQLLRSSPWMWIRPFVFFANTQVCMLVLKRFKISNFLGKICWTCDCGSEKVFFPKRLEECTSSFASTDYSKLKKLSNLLKAWTKVLAQGVSPEIREPKNHLMSEMCSSALTIDSWVSY